MSLEQTPIQNEEERSRSAGLSRQPIHPPTDVPGYEPERFLGKGAFGEVWVATDRNTGRQVAIKFYAYRGGLDWSLLAREVEKLRLLSNDRHVVQLIEVGWDADPPYYVMEYLEHGSLEDCLREGPLPVHEAVTVMREVAVGLNHAHNKGILHCDLKPANILLDQDCKSRLADFGQARLTNEQSPALGTLFYMAPEQADLNAVPDARWDVYALGALLYGMITGQPPYRSDTLAAELKCAEGLQERLKLYQQSIYAAPPIAKRKLPGVDRALAEILARCLAVQPGKRYANVQAVINALDARALQRARRPLLVLGVVGPALLLLVMLVGAWIAASEAIATTTREIVQRSQASNRFAARFAADQVASKIMQRWSILEREAADPELHRLLRQAAGKSQGHADRLALQQWLDSRQSRYDHLKLATSWFVDSDEGKLLAVSPLGLAKRSLDKYFWHRDYFHGRGCNFQPDFDRAKPPDVQPIDAAYQSIVFKSRSEGNPLMVVFSVPIASVASGKTLGVLCMAVELGDFSELWSGNDGTAGLSITLVQTKPDSKDPRAAKEQTPNEGLILEHPELKRLRAQGQQVAEFYLQTDRVESLRRWGIQQEAALRKKGAAANSSETNYVIDDFFDPVGKTHTQYQGRWLAAAEPVVFFRRTGSGDNVETVPINCGWTVIVQENYQDAIRPVQDLERKFAFQVIGFFALIIVVVLALWVFVARGLSDSPGSRFSAYVRRRAGLTSISTTGTGSLTAEQRAELTRGTKAASVAASAAAARPSMKGHGGLQTIMLRLRSK
jgi:hypothetical protein